MVAPGFVDMHSHSDFLLLEDGTAPSKVRQGVTTEVLGEGTSAGLGGHRRGGHNTAVSRDWGRMLVTGKGTYEGLTMDRVIAAKSKGKTPPPDPLDVFLDVLIEEGGSVPTVFERHTEKDMNLALQQPWCSIGSDGSAYATEGPLRRGNPYPRNFGTFPRVLGVCVRERGLLRLEDAVRKMTSANAPRSASPTAASCGPGCSPT